MDNRDIRSAKAYSLVYKDEMIRGIAEKAFLAGVIHRDIDKPEISEKFDKWFVQNLDTLYCLMFGRVKRFIHNRVNTKGKLDERTGLAHYVKLGISVDASCYGHDETVTILQVFTIDDDVYVEYDAGKGEGRLLEDIPIEDALSVACFLAN